MVFVRDEGSTFDAPIDHVWKYIFDGAVHDAVHKTARNSSFEKVSEITFIYSSERLLRGTWAPDKMRISMFQPVSVVTEWLDGVLAGSKVVYLYAPQGERTRIDAYGEFTSKVLGAEEVEATAREFLDTEFEADAPVIRSQYRKAREARR
ncbi:MAG TPA: hypothetical protein VFF67_06020 [Thermoplasmata archaeon]|nr:hypothetical protein [Thermoplasmata archaeon]